MQEPLSDAAGDADSVDASATTASDQPEAQELPDEVDASETIVRVIKTPFHLTKKGDRIRPAAFQPVPDTNELSVIRQRLGDDYCKKMAVEISKPGEYMGLASGLVQVVRDAGAEVVNKQEEFKGHAHIETPFVKTREPLDGPELQAQDRYLDAVMNHFIYQRDPAPHEAGWQGDSLRRSA